MKNPYSELMFFQITISEMQDIALECYLTYLSLITK